MSSPINTSTCPTFLRNFGPPAVAFGLAAAGCFGTLALLGLGAGAALAAKSLSGRCSKPKETPSKTNTAPKQSRRKPAAPRVSAVAKQTISPIQLAPIATKPVPSDAPRVEEHAEEDHPTTTDSPEPAPLEKPTAVLSAAKPIQAPETLLPGITTRVALEQPAAKPDAAKTTRDPAVPADTTVAAPVKRAAKPAQPPVENVQVELENLMEALVEHVVDETSIQVDDPKYHMRDLTLCIDDAEAQRKLDEELDRAASALVKEGVPSEVEAIRFNNACLEESALPVKVEAPIKFKSGTTVFAASAKGLRDTMEDDHLVSKGVALLATGRRVPYEVFGVFDGHGGKQTATYAKEYFQIYFEDELVRRNPNGLTKKGIRNAFKAAFVRLDESIKRQFFYSKDRILFHRNFELKRNWWSLFEKLPDAMPERVSRSAVREMVRAKIAELPSDEQEQWNVEEVVDCLEENSGSTAVVSVKMGDELWTANLGDARAVALIGDEMVQLSVDAKPTRKQTKPEAQWKQGRPQDENRFNTTLFKRGGFTSIWGCVRVNGSLATARAFNDKTLTSSVNAPKEYGQFQEGQYYVITPRPKITVKKLEKGQKVRLCLACDGLWDVATTPLVGPILKVSGKPAARLAAGAINAGSRDNVTVVVADITA